MSGHPINPWFDPFQILCVLSSQVTAPGPFNQAVHYEKVENARKLSEQEFSYNALLGTISLNFH